MASRGFYRRTAREGTTMASGDQNLATAARAERAPWSWKIRPLAHLRGCTSERQRIGLHLAPQRGFPGIFRRICQPVAAAGVKTGQVKQPAGVFTGPRGNPRRPVEDTCMKLNTMGALTLGTLLSIALLPASQAQDNGATEDNDARPGFRRGAMEGGRMGPGRFRELRQAAQPEERLERLDTDGDGSISEEEFLAPQTERIATLFDRRDRDGDGLLSAEETAPPERGRRGDGRGPGGDRRGPSPEAVQACLQAAGDDRPEARPDREDLLAMADSNGDGSLALDELSAAQTDQALQRFARLDTDGDGLITGTELQAQQQARQARRAELRTCLENARANTN